MGGRGRTVSCGEELLVSQSHRVWDGDIGHLQAEEVMADTARVSLASSERTLRGRT